MTFNKRSFIRLLLFWNYRCIAQPRDNEIRNWFSSSKGEFFFCLRLDKECFRYNLGEVSIVTTLRLNPLHTFQRSFSFKVSLLLVSFSPMLERFIVDLLRQTRVSPKTADNPADFNLYFVGFPAVLILDLKTPGHNLFIIAWLEIKQRDQLFINYFGKPPTTSLFRGRSWTCRSCCLMSLNFELIYYKPKRRIML